MQRVAANNFGKNTVDTRGVVDVHNLGYFHELLGDVFVEGAFVEIDTQEGADVPAKFGMVDDELRTPDDAHILHLFHADVYGAPRHEDAFTNLGIGHRRVLHQQAQYFQVDVINFQIFGGFFHSCFDELITKVAKFYLNRKF